MKAFFMIAILSMAQVACAASSANKTTPAPEAVPVAATTPSAGGGFVEEKLKFKVKGMHCGSCANSIKTKVEKVPGVAEAMVDFKSGEVTVISSGPSQLDRKAVTTAIESAGKFTIQK